MRTTNYILAVTVLISSFATFAQKKSIDTQKSTISWIGKKIGGQHEGAIHIKEGTLKIKGANIVTADFTIDMNSITCTDLKDESYNKKLVGHLKSDDFFGVATFPTATFQLVSATKFSNNKASLTGNLTIKGKVEKITFDLIKKEDTYAATIAVDRSKFDVRYGSTSFFDSLGNKAIDDVFTLNIVLALN
jgi:polyisoprenoid-binding protein YceI